VGEGLASSGIGAGWGLPSGMGVVVASGAVGRTRVVNVATVLEVSCGDATAGAGAGAGADWAGGLTPMIGEIR